MLFFYILHLSLWWSIESFYSFLRGKINIRALLKNECVNVQFCVRENWFLMLIDAYHERQKQRMRMIRHGISNCFTFFKPNLADWSFFAIYFHHKGIFPLQRFFTNFPLSKKIKWINENKFHDIKWIAK